MRTACFVINFGLAVLSLHGCLVCLAVGYYEGGSPATLGGMLFLVPAAAFARSEWLAYHWREGDRERRLGWAWLGLAGFAGFGVAANAAEAPLSAWPSGFGWFIAVGLAIAAYFAVCGWSRVRRWHDRTWKKSTSTLLE